MKEATWTPFWKWSPCIEIGMLFGATDMQVWNINLDLKHETLDLSRFRKEFVEYRDDYLSNRAKNAPTREEFEKLLEKCQM